MSRWMRCKCWGFDMCRAGSVVICDKALNNECCQEDYPTSTDMVIRSPSVIQCARTSHDSHLEPGSA